MDALGLKPEKKQKLEEAPTKPPLSYNLWLRDGNSDRIKAAKPKDSKDQQWFQKTAGAEWKALSDEDKQPYQDQYKVLKVNF